MIHQKTKITGEIGVDEELKEWGTKKITEEENDFVLKTEIGKKNWKKVKPLSKESRWTVK